MLIMIDDVSVICNYLKVTKFSMLAHSAGAIYALATALRMPQHIRGRLHLLAPWIPPSQMSGPGAHKEALPAVAVPYSQRILRALPTPFLKAANSSFMSATSASISSALPKSPRKTKRKSIGAAGRETPALRSETPGLTNAATKRNSTFYPQPPSETMPSAAAAAAEVNPTSPITSTAPNDEGVIDEATLKTLEKLRQNDYDNRLTHAIWDYATTNANPAVDLLVCLERRQPIGFRYVDITRAVVIHHGTRDTRVPVDNVKWLGKTMRRCEVRILEGEGHGLMASAGVMGNILMEIAKEWEDWSVVTGKKTDVHRKKSVAREAGYV
jgi:pimeloyl-ACP methyl ester carboxylesterase